jgi:thiamine-phosphate pyrophosphorylase
MILHLVTDRRRLIGPVPLDAARRCLARQAQFAIDAHIDCIHIRERDLEAADLADLATEVVRITRGTATQVVVNDRVDVALASRADGVHLRADSVPAEAVRRMTPRGFLIGRSVHTPDEAARVTGADYLVAGTVWPSGSKPAGQALLGLHGFASIVEATTIPVLAIGGVTAARVADVAAAGGAGIAAIGLFIDETLDSGCRAIALVQTADAMRRRFDTSGSGS